MVIILLTSLIRNFILIVVGNIDKSIVGIRVGILLNYSSAIVSKEIATFVDIVIC